MTAIPRAQPMLERSPATYHGREREHENLHVQPQGPALDVISVKTNYFFEVGHRAPPFDLPQSRYPGLRSKTAKVVIAVVGEVGLKKRPGAHERHISHQHIPKLRQLVEAPAAQPAPELRHPRIVGNLEQPR